MTQSALKEGRTKSLEYSIKDGAAFSIMTGFGEQYLSPLAIELGATNTEIGLLASVPSFVASLSQLYTSNLVKYFKSRRKTITFFVLLQALTWIPLALVPEIAFMRNVFILIFFVSLYFTFGQLVGPAWNSLIGDLVNESVRGRFFGMRNRITGAIAFFSLFMAGFILGVFPKNDLLQGFTIIFLIAFAARLVSWYYLNKTEDPPMRLDETGEFTFIQYLRRLQHTNYGKFALYFGFMNFSVYVAGPFFTVYMLRDLNMSYFDYTIVTAAAALSSFLAMAYWGRIADRFGNKMILNFCGIALALVPVLWLFSSDMVYLVFAQIISGFVWAGFNLSSSNFIYDNVKPANRTRIFAYHNVLSGTSIFLGAIAGSVLIVSVTTPFIFYSILQVIFLVSGILRAVTSLFFLPMIREIRAVEQISHRDFFIKYGGTGPVMGMTYRTVTLLGNSMKKIRKP